jgi:hypothetical protein
LNLADVDLDESCDRRQSLTAVPHLIDCRLQPGEVACPPFRSVGADMLRGLVEALPLPRIDSAHSMQHDSDRCGIVGIGSVSVTPLLIRLGLGLSSAIPRTDLLIRVHISAT